ncbi:UNVERIFIED_CONTAM: hypothetical protein GTU68_046089 [Idotea baltica]|nr:hypothetical protein [Idotea baltica]
MDKLSHFNQSGDAHMVNVGAKEVTHRVAISTGRIEMLNTTLEHILSGDNKKGDVLGVARIAGIMGAKRTADLVPLCHPLALTKVEIELTTQKNPPAVICTATVETRGQTGVEMEALNAVQITLLTIYDMCKAVDKGMRIEGVSLLEKRGGKSGNWIAADHKS